MLELRLGPSPLIVTRARQFGCGGSDGGEDLADAAFAEEGSYGKCCDAKQLLGA